MQESFDYGTNNDTTKFLRGDNNHNGGTGWADEWNSIEGTNGVRLNTTVEQSIQYPGTTDLSSVGGRVEDFFGGKSRRAFASLIGDNMYFSALIRWGGAGNTMSIELGNTTDVRWTAFDVDSDGKLRVGVDGLSAGFVQLTAGAEYIVVGRRTSVITTRTSVGSVFDISNPGEFYTEPVSWDMTDTIISGVVLSHLDLEVDGTNGINMIDEIRFGTTYESVVGTYIPERKQGAFMVGLFCLQSLVARRRLHMS